MRNIWKILFIFLLCITLVSTAVFAITLTNFYNGSGVRILGSSVHFSTRQTCYFIDESRGEIIGQGEFLASAFVLGDYVSGVISIDQYPLTANDMLQFSCLRHNSDTLRFNSQSIADIAELSNQDWVRYYDVWVCDPDMQGQPKAIVTHIHEHNQKVIYAVCAKSEEEAWTNFEIYKDYLNK